MKNILLLSLLLLTKQWCFAQWSEEEIKPYRQKADRAVKTYVDKMIRNGEWDKEDDAFEIEFVTDTMRIERTIAFLEDDGHYSTMDMHNSISYRMTEYDKLLNKYYRLLMNKLSDGDKVKLRDAQREWLKYRDSEEKINNEIIAPNNYMGGGTMWPLVARARTLDIIVERVCSFYEFITCI